MATCEGCGKADNTGEEVKSTCGGRWTVGGGNCFDFNWYFSDGNYYLCEECESRDWEICNDCGALIDGDFCGNGYLPDDYEGEDICPACADKRGFPVTVGVFKK